MNKPISKNVHGFIDYGYAIMLPLMPEIAGFKKQRTASLLCRGLGAGAFAYTLLTKARWGLIPLLPFKKHLLLDASISLLAIAAPWLLGFSKNSAARNTLVGVGLAGLSAALLTNPVEQEDQQNRYLFI